MWMLQLVAVARVGGLGFFGPFGEALEECAGVWVVFASASRAEVGQMPQLTCGFMWLTCFAGPAGERAVTFQHGETVWFCGL